MHSSLYNLHLRLHILVFSCDAIPDLLDEFINTLWYLCDVQYQLKICLIPLILWHNLFIVCSYTTSKCLLIFFNLSCAYPGVYCQNPHPQSQWLGYHWQKREAKIVQWFWGAGEPPPDQCFHGEGQLLRLSAQPWGYFLWKHIRVSHMYTTKTDDMIFCILKYSMAKAQYR